MHCFEYVSTHDELMVRCWQIYLLTLSIPSLIPPPPPQFNLKSDDDKLCENSLYNYPYENVITHADSSGSKIIQYSRTFFRSSISSSSCD